MTTAADDDDDLTLRLSVEDEAYKAGIRYPHPGYSTQIASEVLSRYAKYFCDMPNADKLQRQHTLLTLRGLCAVLISQLHRPGEFTTRYAFCGEGLVGDSHCGHITLDALGGLTINKKRKAQEIPVEEEGNSTDTTEVMVLTLKPLKPSLQRHNATVGFESAKRTRFAQEA